MNYSDLENDHIRPQSWDLLGLPHDGFHLRLPPARSAAASGRPIAAPAEIGEGREARDGGESTRCWSRGAALEHISGEGDGEDKGGSPVVETPKASGFRGG